MVLSVCPSRPLPPHHTKDHSLRRERFSNGILTPPSLILYHRSWAPSAGQHVGRARARSGGEDGERQKEFSDKGSWQKERKPGRRFRLHHDWLVERVQTCLKLSYREMKSQQDANIPCCGNSLDQGGIRTGNRAENSGYGLYSPWWLSG